MPINDPKLIDLHLELGGHLDEIAKLFKPGVRLTLVVRNPEQGPEAGLVIGDDELDEAVEEIRRRQRQTGER
jgi:hypothetical protein